MQDVIISVEYIQKSQDVDAAIYLLGRLLGTSSPTADANREKMQGMLNRIERTRFIKAKDRQQIATLYREIRTS